MTTSSHYFWTCYCSPIFAYSPVRKGQSGLVTQLDSCLGYSLLIDLDYCICSKWDLCSSAQFLQTKASQFLFTVELLLLYHEVDKNIILLCIEIFNTIFHLTLVFPLSLNNVLFMFRPWRKEITLFGIRTTALPWTLLLHVQIFDQRFLVLHRKVDLI